MISVSLQGISVRFDSLQVLDDIHLQVQPGELFFLLGPSGCGKTTLLRTIAGFCKPDKGRLLFDEQEVTGLPPHKRHTAMVFQSYALWPHMTVEKNVGFGLAEQRLPKTEIAGRVEEALECVQMAHCKARRIQQLSGGQQQRVALARALVVRPRCLLLDEPLSNLDTHLRQEMRNLIRDNCRRFKLTAIYVTHDQKEALSVADRIAILSQGRLCQIGTPRELYKRPHSQLVANFIGETNFIPGKLVALTKEQAIVETALGQFHGILPAAGPTPGSAVVLSIRPECWRFSGAPLNSFTGTILDSVYLGETIQHRVGAGDLELKVSQLNPLLEDPVQKQGLQLSVQPEDVIVLSA